MRRWSFVSKFWVLLKMQRFLDLKIAIFDSNNFFFELKILTQKQPMYPAIID
jgi:hypothetical protein